MQWSGRRTLLVASWVSAGAIVALAGFLAVPGVSPHAKAMAVNVASIVVAANGAFACARSACASRGRQRAAWALLAAATASWGLGQVAWTVYEEVLRVPTPFPSWADVGYVGFLPLAALALLSFPTDDTRLTSRIRMYLDAAILATSFGLLGWLLFLQPLAQGEPGAALALALTYPLGDIILASLAAILLLRVPRESRLPWLLLGVGILAFTVSDIGFSYLTTIDAYSTGTLLDLGWIVGLHLVALSALVAVLRGGPLPVLGAHPTGGRVVWPYVPICVDIVVGAAYFGRGGLMDGMIFGSIVVLGLFLILRQLLMTEEVRRLSADLRATLDRLNAANADRTRLLNVITHDLYTPITPIRLSAEMMVMEGSPPIDPEHRRSVEIILRNTDQLQRLVSDVKDLARLETGSLALRLKPSHLEAVIAPAVESFERAAEERGVRLESRIEEGLVVEADEGRITQVLYNLIANALKFTPKGGTVRVEANQGPKGVEVSVRDSGRGLTPEEMGRLFQPFSQVHQPGEVAERGTGLGLFISRGIALQHHGDLWVESEGPQRGSTFHLVLPRAASGSA